MILFLIASDRLGIVGHDVLGASNLVVEGDLGNIRRTATTRRRPERPAEFAG